MKLTASEELDALVMALTEKCQRENTYDALYDDAADTITTLRAQLAAETNRANRAEAERAAQIEEDAGTETCGRCMGSGYGGHPDSGAVCPDCNGSGGVRAQPHSRTALDALAFAVDWGDRITDAVGWCRIGRVSEPVTIEATP